MGTVHLWKEVLQGIEQALGQVEAAAAARERELEVPAVPTPLAPDSAWQTALFAWDGLVAKLPAAAAEAERECRDADAVLASEENTFAEWLRATEATRQKLAQWDNRHVS